MDFIHTTLAFIFVLGLLIFVHEYGHFWVARRCGVKVLRFSIGFGPLLFSRHDKHGTEFALSAIPFGGYVKMLDEREGDVPHELLSQTFNRKSVGQRIAIVAAGPLVNLMFAVFIYWVMFMTGVTALIPVVGEVQQNSPAAIAGIQSGQEIVSIDGKETQSWESVTFALLKRIGDSGEMLVGVRSADASYVENKVVAIHAWLVDLEQNDPLAVFGIQPFMPTLAPVLGDLIESGAAHRAGLQKGDRMLSVDAKEITEWSQWVAIIQAYPGKTLDLEIERQGQQLHIALTPDAVDDESGKRIGRVGAQVWVPNDFGTDNQRIVRYDPLMAASAAWNKMWERSVLTVETLGKMLIGLISVNNLSGPITIAKIAGQTASYGPEAFFSFIAYLSISLGILNLLPIPALDGGHLVYYLIELVKGKAISERVQTMGMKLGMTILLAFMILAIYNDFTRL